jgi:hypothetical protein
LSVLLGDAPAVLSKAVMADAVQQVPAAHDWSESGLPDVPAEGWIQLPTHKSGGHVIVDHNPLPNEKLYDLFLPGGANAQSEFALVPEPGVLLAGLAAVGLLLQRRRGRQQPA